MRNKRPREKSGISRRDFLKGFGSGALGAAVVPKLLAQKAESLSTRAGDVPVYTRKKIQMRVNGVAHTLVVEPQETLLETLRDRLNLSGSKKICDRGECGGCTVLLNGFPVYSCMTLTLKAEGTEVTTVEGLARNGTLHPVQKAFIEKNAYQCGFCTPGFLITAAALLEKSPDPGLEDIQKALSGNLCRCGNYVKIHEAVAEAARQARRG
ncbi:MAG: 2Fe-2S iron-sulfur cluster-binding protein [Candidatus Aminicenantales bacterium]